MRVCYKSYLDFLLKADLLANELALNPNEAAELLAKLSGYQNHGTMPIGQECSGPSPSREDLVIRLLAVRPDIGVKRASHIITHLDLSSLPESSSLPAPASGHTDRKPTLTGSPLH